MPLIEIEREIVLPCGTDGCLCETINVAMLPTMQSGNCFKSPKPNFRKIERKI